MKNVTLIKVFIASPGEVLEKRNEVEQIILDWNNEYGDLHNIFLMPVRWENNSTASYGLNISGQAIINEQIVKSSDILIAIFGNTLGTRTTNNKSGTIEEIEVFYQEHQRGIGIFFVDALVPENMIQERYYVKQYREFLARNERGLYGTYDLRKIRQFITKEVNELVEGNNGKLNSAKESNFSEMHVFDDMEFDQDEQLFFIFIIEEEIHFFGAGWKSNQTIIKIKEWEEKNHLNNYLSNRYYEILPKLSKRNFIAVEEVTDYGNPRLYSIDSENYREIKRQIISNSSSVSNLKLRFPEQDTHLIQNNDLPF